MTVIAKAEVTISDILDGNSISEITNFYKVSSKSSGETAPQTSGGRNLAKKTNQGAAYWEWIMKTGDKTIAEYIENGIRCCEMTRGSIEYSGWSVIYYYDIGRNKLEAGEQYTISFEVKGNVSTNFGMGLLSTYGQNMMTQTVQPSTAPTVANQWSKCTYVATLKDPLPTVTDQVVYLTGMQSGTGISYIFKNLKIEKGNKATDWTPAPEDLEWSTTVPTLTATNKYLWNYEMITGSDGQVISYTEPRVIGVYGDKGQTGSTGATGNGIKSITEYYQISTSNTTAPTTWLTTVPTLTATNKYLWNYEKITYTNGTSVDTAKRVIGVYGDKGNTGATGPAGKGIKSTAITYQASTSGTTAPTGTWNTSVPSVPQGQYLWSRTVITYTDNTTSTTYSVAYIPKNGATGGTGPTGPTGTGIANITQQYYLSTSKTSQTGGSWVTSMPTWSSGKYLWTRYKIDYKNPASTSYTTPVCDSSWEAVNDIQVGGRNLIIGTSKAEVNANWKTNGWDGNFTTYEPGIYRLQAKNGWYCCRYTGLTDYIGKTVTISFQAMCISEETTSDELWGLAISNAVGTNPFVTEMITHDTPEKDIWLYLSKTVVLNEDGQIGIVARCSKENVGHDTVWLIKNLKLELGNVATDWSPAPEDVDQGIKDAQSSADKAQSTADSVGNRVTVAESQIKQVKDSISMMVTDENGSSLMTQTSDGWTFNIGGIQNTLYDARDKLGELTGSVSGLNDTTKKLDSLITDITKKTAYINMATDSSGNPCIELGKVGDPFKVRITNTSVDFIEGSSRIAYISNNALYIEKAIIKNELQIGDGSGFIWRKRSNGNLGLRRT